VWDNYHGWRLLRISWQLVIIARNQHGWESAKAGWGYGAAVDGPDPVSLVCVVDPPIQSLHCDTTKLRI
jgi:hypothetical protein